jgi:UTP:GlnB (protein PII) uridylyltransferase
MTVGERAEDVFYITDSGGSILSDDLSHRVQDSLVRALDRRDTTRV